MPSDTNCHTGAPAPTVPAADDTIVASIDAAGVGEEYVIADISADGAWLSMNAAEAPALPAWR
ncbi:DUF7556 family protein [Natronobiforma cellulositropha]|uniref:DUF7556 family protein n=1 Tax=Natronobiforma cellulositropha TaxID=1679076 RepID=UPI0021D56AF5|nr:hypothetical protein [Natronobiforma cellulositropha]